MYEFYFCEKLSISKNKKNGIMVVKKILFADVDESMLEEFDYFFQQEGFMTTIVKSGNDLIEKATSFQPNVIVLEVKLPNRDGIDLCLELRKMPDFQDISIIFLSSHNEDFIRVSALDAGADDYFVKPIKPRLLFSHIRAIQRIRQQINKETKKNIEAIILNPNTLTISIEDKNIRLVKKEFEIFQLLFSVPNKVFRREEIYEKVWHESESYNERLIDVHIRKLRKKIGNESIETYKGIGYRLNILIA